MSRPSATPRVMSTPYFTRAQLIAQFWSEVRARLMLRDEKSACQAEEGIKGYLRLTAALGLGDSIYHQGVEQMAEVVRAVIENGLPPLPLSNEVMPFGRLTEQQAADEELLVGPPSSRLNKGAPRKLLWQALALLASFIAGFMLAALIYRQVRP